MVGTLFLCLEAGLIPQALPEQSEVGGVGWGGAEQGGVRRPCSTHSAKPHRACLLFYLPADFLLPFCCLDYSGFFPFSVPVVCKF